MKIYDTLKMIKKEALQLIYLSFRLYIEFENR